MANELVPVAQSFSLPVAKVRPIFNLEEVQHRLAKLDEAGGQREHEALRSTYQRMLERGPDRFQVKPSGVPDMSMLYNELPNFTDALDDIRRQVALSQDTSDGLEVTPMLLLGPAGIGKTRFARKIANLLGTGMNLIPMSSMTAGWLLSGSSSQWKGSKPGKVFQALVDGQYANPVIVVDEVDKASANAQYDPLGALYGLLEHDSALDFTDEFAEVSIDASQVVWVFTANDERSIPGPIMNRLNVFEVEVPVDETARRVALGLYQTIRAEHGWGERFAVEPEPNTLECLAKLVPREMRRALMTGFGNARLDGRDTVKPCDLPTLSSRKKPIGFTQ